MNILDIVLGIILLVAFFSGLKKELFVTLSSFIGLIAGVYCAIYFSNFAAEYLSQWFNWSEQTTNLAAFAVTFLGVLLLISTAGKFLTKIADMAFLGIFNKILGGAFQALMVAFILSVVFMFLNSSETTENLISDEKKESSYLYTPVASLAPLLVPYILKEVEDLREKSDSDNETPAANDES